MIRCLVKGFSPKIFLGLSIFFMVNLPASMAEMVRKAEQKEILVIGTGTIIDGNVAAARKMALSEALIKGVEEYLTRRLGRQGMVDNFSRLIHEVIPKAREQIENFHILTEDRIDKDYKILVRLKVNEKVMEEKLREIGLILMEGPPIKVLFLVSQIKPREGQVSYWWKDPESESALTAIELVLYRVFQERGFQPINRLTNIPEGEYSYGMKALYLSDEDAIKWGKLFSADLVIHGRCEIIEGREVSVILKALDTERGFIISQDSETEGIDEGHGSIDQIIEVIDKAINRIAMRLGPAIIGAVEASEATVSQLEITLQGLSHFKQIKAFRDFLIQDIAGVQSVVQTRAKGTSVSFMVEFLGESDKFLARAANHEHFPFNADVTKAEEGKIIFNLR